MPPPLSRLTVLRATESHCLDHGVDTLTLEAIAKAVSAQVGAVSALFHDETSLLDAVLERHQASYEREWEDVFPAIHTARDALRLLASTIARRVHDEDGGVAYVTIAAQMCTGARFTLTGRPATTTPAALRLIGKLTEHTKLPFELMPARFERFAVVLFSSVLAWYRHGAARAPEPLFVEDLVDCLEFVSLAPLSADANRALQKAGA